MLKRPASETDVVKPRSRVAHRALRFVVCSIAAVLVLGGVGIGWAYVSVNSSLRTVDLDAALGSDRPPRGSAPAPSPTSASAKDHLPGLRLSPSPNSTSSSRPSPSPSATPASPRSGSTNVLVLGSDSRAGDNAAYGTTSLGARSDVAMIVHLNDGRRSASVVSIPRDTLVTRPACVTPEGAQDLGGPRKMFNESFAVGGAACAVKTVESFSGLRIDHLVQVDFTGFKRIVDALGGVEITVSKRIADRGSHLDLAVGTHRIDGEQALALVRTRKSIGDGGDLGRIRLQQVFLQALMREITDMGLLSQPKKLYELAEATAMSITTDRRLGTVASLLNFAASLKELNTDNIQMITMPVEPDRVDPNRVVPTTHVAEAVWGALRADQPLPPSSASPTGGAKDSAPPPVTFPAEPSTSPQPRMTPSAQ